MKEAFDGAGSLISRVPLGSFVKERVNKNDIS